MKFAFVVTLPGLVMTLYGLMPDSAVLSFHSLAACVIQHGQQNGVSCCDLMQNQSKEEMLPIVHRQILIIVDSCNAMDCPHTLASAGLGSAA